MEKRGLNTKTNRALNNVITAIIESNVSEKEGLLLTAKTKETILSIFKKKNITNNGVSIKILNEDVYVKLTISIEKSFEFLKEIELLQAQIANEVKILTGLNVKKIDVLINRLHLNSE